MMDDAKKLTAWGMDDGVHDALSLKPITTPEQQIDLLKGKCVTFERCAEERALDILSSAETYLHLSAYRVLFQRHEDGFDAGKFVSLDFGDLLDVSSLDDVLRETFRLMAKDVERAVRAWLVSEAAGARGGRLWRRRRLRVLPAARLSRGAETRPRIAVPGGRVRWVADRPLPGCHARMGAVGSGTVRDAARLLPLLR